jgi:hypothetical protein
MTPARDALETMRLCFAAERSAETGRVVRLESAVEGDMGDDAMATLAAAPIHADA